MADELFRKESLERLASPERLDSLMAVASPKLWLVLVGCLVLVGAGLAWGFLDRTADNVAGQGLLTREGGVYQVDMPCTAELTQVLVKAGATVRKDQVLAVIARPELDVALGDAQARVRALQSRRAKYLPLLQSEQSSDNLSFQNQMRRSQEEIRDARQRAGFLDLRVAAMGKALEKGLITPDQLQQLITEHADARDRLAEAEARIPQFKGNLVDTEVRLTGQAFNLDQELESARDQVARLRVQLDLESRLTAPVTGKVLELVHRSGDRLGIGTAVLRIEGDVQALTCYLFVPDQGKRIRPGMPVELNPAGILKEEYGSMVGTVRSVSMAPMGLEAIGSLLRNPRLAENLGGRGDAFLVEVAPHLDARTPSGFKWTSRLGPQAQFGVGTLLSGQVTVERQAPITLVIPALKKWLLGY